MKGCLSLPFRLLGLALLVLGGYLAWSHRDEIRRRIHHWTAEKGAGAAPDSLARRLGDASLAPAASRKLEGLSRSRSDSVVLSAAEVADLISAAAAEHLPGALDSIEVRLAPDDLEVRARLDTRKVALSPGLLSGLIRDHEPVEAGGRPVFQRPGVAEWQVTRARVRGIPLPREVLGRLLRGFGQGGEANSVPVPLPLSVGGLRVASAGVVVYGSAPGGRP